MWFRRFISWKICLNLLAGVVVAQGSTLLGLALVMSAVAASLRSGFRFGLFAVLAFAVWDAAAAMPYTINHRGLEVFALLLLAVTPRAEERGLEDVLRLCVLAVWFFSGLQKVASDSFLSGEMFVVVAMNGEGHLAEILRATATGLFGSIDWSAQSAGAMFGVASGALPYGVIYWFRALAIGTVVIELVLPIWALRSRVPVLFLIVFNLLLIVFTGEWDIAFICIGMMLMYFPEIARAAYTGAIGIYAVRIFS